MNQQEFDRLTKSIDHNLRISVANICVAGVVVILALGVTVARLAGWLVSRPIPVWGVFAVLVPICVATWLLAWKYTK